MNENVERARGNAGHFGLCHDDAGWALAAFERYEQAVIEYEACATRDAETIEKAVGLLRDVHAYLVKGPPDKRGDIYFGIVKGLDEMLFPERGKAVGPRDEPGHGRVRIHGCQVDEADVKQINETKDDLLENGK